VGINNSNIQYSVQWHTFTLANCHIVQLITGQQTVCYDISAKKDTVNNDNVVVIIDAVQLSADSSQCHIGRTLDGPNIYESQLLVGPN